MYLPVMSGRVRVWCGCFNFHFNRSLSYINKQIQRTGFVFNKAGKLSSLMFTYSHNQKSVGIQNQVRNLSTFNSAASLHVADLGQLNSSKNRVKTNFIWNVFSPLSVTHSEWVVQLQEDDGSEILLTCFWSLVRVWIDTTQSLSVKS